MRSDSPPAGDLAHLSPSLPRTGRRPATPLQPDSTVLASSRGTGRSVWSSASMTPNALYWQRPCGSVRRADSETVHRSLALPRSRLPQAPIAARTSRARGSVPGTRPANDRPAKACSGLPRLSMVSAAGPPLTPTTKPGSRRTTMPNDARPKGLSFNTQSCGRCQV